MLDSSRVLALALLCLEVGVEQSSVPQGLGAPRLEEEPEIPPPILQQQLLLRFPVLAPILVL